MELDRRVLPGPVDCSPSEPIKVVPEETGDELRACMLALDE